MHKATLLCLALTCASGTTQAASDAAWAEHNQQLIDACLSASQLKHPQPVGQPAEFDDAVGYSAVLLQGRYPQPHMKNRLGRELCLFDKRQQVAHTREWDSVMSAPKP